jgi:YD repeat-containing protein
MRLELNKLRTVANCMATTYTYKPLVGVTSETDPNGKTIFYEYDTFNRLVLIKDKDNNILKKFCYNYAGQAENCVTPTVYFNIVASQTFTKNNCGGCSAGSQVTYTVPANTYSSTLSLQAAQQLALDDIAANGQNYANTNGTCTSGGLIPITYSNTYNYTGFTALYTNSTTGLQYSFTIPAGTGALGCVPSGQYTIAISNSGMGPYIIFGTGCYTIEGTSATFRKVQVDSTSGCTTISLTDAN